MISILLSNYLFQSSNSPKHSFIQLINHALIFHHLLRFICINLLNFLELYLDLLLFAISII